METISITSLDYKTLKSEEIMGKLGIPNIYKLIVHQTVNLIFKVKHNTMPEAFLTKFQIVQHKYVRRHRKIIFEKLKITFKFQSLLSPQVDLFS